MKALILAVTLLPILTSVTAQTDSRYVGCYKSSGRLTRVEIGASSPRATCRETCTSTGNFAVEALTKGTECYCGASLPPEADKVGDSSCGASCSGGGDGTCGSSVGDYFSFYLTGVSTSPPVDPNNNSTVTTAGGNNTTTTRGSNETQTSIPSNTTKHEATTSKGPATTKTGGSAGTTGASSAAATSTSAGAGDSVQVGSGMLIGAVIGILAMVF